MADERGPRESLKEDLLRYGVIIKVEDINVTAPWSMGLPRWNVATTWIGSPCLFYSAVPLEELAQSGVEINRREKRQTLAGQDVYCVVKGDRSKLPPFHE